MDAQKHTRKIAFTVGILLLIEFLTVVYDCMFLAPKTGVQTLPEQIVLSILLVVLNAGLCFTVVSLLSRITDRKGKMYLFVLFGLMSVRTLISLTDAAALGHLVSAHGSSANTSISQTGLYQTRLLTHNIDVLFSFLTFVVFFAVMLRTGLLPSAISVWGVAASVIAVARQILSFYGICTELNFVYFLPFASVRVFISLWLIVIGFSKPPQPIRSRRALRADLIS
jgi:hypothetical protein